MEHETLVALVGARASLVRSTVFLGRSTEGEETMGAFWSCVAMVAIILATALAGTEDAS